MCAVVQITMLGHQLGVGHCVRESCVCVVLSGSHRVKGNSSSSAVILYSSVSGNGTASSINANSTLL